MITIIAPNNNTKERDYIINILLKEFLGISYKIIFSSNDDYQIVLPNNNKITILDSFFSSYKENLSYLTKRSIPKKIKNISSEFFSEKNLPIFWGTGSISIKKNSIDLDIDIFATLFFMLTRWEEYVINDRDEHNRFPAESSLAYKNDFLDRAIVNEYVEFFWNLLTKLEYKGKRKDRKFSMLLTHDIDEIERFPTIKKMIKGMGGDILYRKSLTLPFKTLYEYIELKLGIKKDPYDTFEKIMDISDKFDLKSHFFFMAGGTTQKYDNRYDIKSEKSFKILNTIKSRGHSIGIHPSYNAYNNAKQFKKEKDTLEEVLSSKLESGREHYLRFEVPTTWQLWDNNNFKWCSNLAYANKSGFRAGCCYSYHPFNILTRKKLNIIERPLILMEATFAQEVKSVEEFNQLSDYYFDIVQKYQGEFVLLWHNASFNESTIKKYTQSYLHILNKYHQRML